MARWKGLNDAENACDRRVRIFAMADLGVSVLVWRRPRGGGHLGIAQKRKGEPFAIVSEDEAARDGGSNQRAGLGIGGADVDWEFG